MDLKAGDTAIYVGVETKNMTRDKEYRILTVVPTVEKFMITIFDDTGRPRTFHTNLKTSFPFKKKTEISQSLEFSVARPKHYHHGGIDVFKYMEANWNKERVAGFYAGNILKYITRYDMKGGYEDLEKAETYLKALMALERGDSNDERGEETTPNPEHEKMP